MTDALGALLINERLKEAAKPAPRRRRAPSGKARKSAKKKKRATRWKWHRTADPLVWIKMPKAGYVYDPVTNQFRRPRATDPTSDYPLGATDVPFPQL